VIVLAATVLVIAAILVARPGRDSPARARPRTSLGRLGRCGNRELEPDRARDRRGRRGQA
jgi:hypothetical protein